MGRHTIFVKHSIRRHDWRTFSPVLILCTAMLLFVAYVLVAEYREELPQKSDVPVVTLANGQDLHLDRSKLDSSELHVFEANGSGQKVKFLIQRTPDKAVHVALATCRACYRSHNPHYARNGALICGKCRESMIFESESPETTNHCKLVEIPHKETDHEVTVSRSEVLAAATKLNQ